jgi:hypothetical protein
MYPPSSASSIINMISFIDYLVFAGINVLSLLSHFAIG